LQKELNLIPRRALRQRIVLGDGRPFDSLGDACLAPVLIFCVSKKGPQSLTSDRYSGGIPSSRSSEGEKPVHIIKMDVTKRLSQSVEPFEELR
jgi:hypothetical protein